MWKISTLICFFGLVLCAYGCSNDSVHSTGNTGNTGDTGDTGDTGNTGDTGHKDDGGIARFV